MSAEVAELADARGSGPRTRKGVGVRVPSSAPNILESIVYVDPRRPIAPDEFTFCKLALVLTSSRKSHLIYPNSKRHFLGPVQDLALAR